MQKLNAHGKLVLGLLVALTAALPLACGSDDSNGVPSEKGGATGEGGEAGEGVGGKGGAGKGGAGKGGAGKGGAGEGGSTAAGSGGAPEAGAAEMGGEAGAAEAMGGAGGAEEMAGAAGAGADAYDANVDAACTTEGSLNCSGSGAAVDKQNCVDGYTGLPELVEACGAKVKAFIACIAPLPASSFECMETQASQKAEVCTDEYVALGTCFG